MTLRRITGAAAALTIGLLGAFATASPAQAADEHLPTDPWAANGESFVVGPTTVHLQDHVDGDTSIETATLGLNITAGAEVTVEYELKDGATCESGEPRVFAFVNGNLNKSVQCDATGQAETTGALSFTSADSGLVERVGLVYSRATGHVVLKNLTVDGQLVLFGDRCEFDAELLAALDTCVEPEPTPTPSADPSPTPTTTETEPPASGTGGSDGDSDGDDGKGGELAQTGASTPLLAGGALAALAAGGGLYLVARKRRVTFTA